MNGKDVDSLESWNPMIDMYYGPLNVAHGLGDSEPPITALLGLRLKTTDIPCRFNDGVSGHCWKAGCKMAHPIGTENILRPLPPASTIYNLPKKCRASTQSYMLVNVTHVNNPFDFYVVPRFSFECCCDDSCNQKGDHPKLGFSMLSNMTKTLGKYMSLKMSSIQTDSYEIDQLVACRVNVGTGGLQWYRGVVRETVKADPHATGIPTVPVQLIDIGSKLDVPFVRCAILPSYVSIFPPFAYRCCLTGIIPVGYRFNTDAISFFKKLVLDKVLLLEVNQTIFAEDQTSPIIFEDPAYGVTLRTLNTTPNVLKTYNLKNDEQNDFDKELLDDESKGTDENTEATDSSDEATDLYEFSSSEEECSDKVDLETVEVALVQYLNKYIAQRHLETNRKVSYSFWKKYDKLSHNLLEKSVDYELSNNSEKTNPSRNGHLVERIWKSRRNNNSLTWLLSIRIDSALKKLRKAKQEYLANIDLMVIEEYLIRKMNNGVKNIFCEHGGKINTRVMSWKGEDTLRRPLSHKEAMEDLTWTANQSLRKVSGHASQMMAKKGFGFEAYTYPIMPIPMKIGRNALGQSWLLKPECGDGEE